MPVPESVTLCGLPLALSVIVTDALREPCAVGVKTTEIVQLALGPTGKEQVLFWPKSPVFAPVIATLLMFSAPVPVFVTITICGFDAVPMI